MSTHHDIAVDIRDLQVTFTGGRQPVRAVNGVDLQVRVAKSWLCLASRDRAKV